MKKFLLFILFSLLTITITNAQVSEHQVIKEQNIEVVISDNLMQITGATQGTQFAIRNMLGGNVFVGTINNDKESFELNLKRGVYVIVINSKVYKRFKI